MVSVKFPSVRSVGKSTLTSSPKLAVQECPPLHVVVVVCAEFVEGSDELSELPDEASLYTSTEITVWMPLYCAVIDALPGETPVTSPFA